MWNLNKRNSSWEHTVQHVHVLGGGVFMGGFKRFWNIVYGELYVYTYIWRTYLLFWWAEKTCWFLQNSFLRIAWGGSNKVNIFPKLNGGLEVIYRDGICKQINLNKHKLLSSGTKLCQLQNRIDFRGSNFWFQSRIMECSWWQFVTHLLPENCA